MNYTFESYLGRIKDKNVRKHYMQMAYDGEKTLILESKDEYTEYVNYLIESQKIDVNSLTLEQQVLLAKHPEIFLEIFDAIKKFGSKAIDTAKGVVKAGASWADKNISKIPGIGKAYKAVKSWTKGLMLKLKLFITKQAKKVIDFYKKLSKKTWFRVLSFIVIGVIYPFLSPLSLIKKLLSGDFFPKGKTVREIMVLIRNSSEEVSAKVDKNIEKLEKKVNRREQAKTKKAQRDILGDSFESKINYGNMFYEVRDFVNKDFEMYNEDDSYFYNELTAAQLPHAGSTPPGDTRVGYRFKLNGQRIHIGVDIIDNSIYGFDKTGDFDDEELQDFLDMVFGPGKTISSNHYKWKKGEWKKIFAAIETGKVGADSGSGTDSGGADKGGTDKGGGRKKITPPPMKDEDMEEDDSEDMGDEDSSSISGGRSNRQNKNRLNVTGNNNRINIGGGDFDEYDGSDGRNYNPSKIDRPNPGFWAWLGNNGGAIISGILIGLALAFIAYHVFTWYTSIMNTIATQGAQIATQGAQIAALEGRVSALEAAQKGILSIAKKAKPSVIYNIIANEGSAVAIGQGAIATVVNNAPAVIQQVSQVVAENSI